jgi:hypothetical protein
LGYKFARINFAGKHERCFQGRRAGNILCVLMIPQQLATGLHRAGQLRFGFVAVLEGHIVFGGNVVLLCGERRVAKATSGFWSPHK